MHEMATSLNDVKKPTFVLVYEKLYPLLTDGRTFPVGSKLPSESSLAESLGVSRMTLRQALALLEEDNIIEKIQGKGNFIKERNQPGVSSVEQFGSPVYLCSKSMIDDIEMDFRLEVPNIRELNMFALNTAVIVAVDLWYRSQGKLIAYTLALMPIETITKLGLDLNDRPQITAMLTQGVYDLADRSRLVIQPTGVGKFISEKYVLSESDTLVLIMETIYQDNDSNPIIFNKHYFVPDCFSIEVRASKKSNHP